MTGCIGCGGAVKGTFPLSAETLDKSIRRAAAKVLSGRASYIRMTMRDADVRITQHTDVGGPCALIIIDYPDGSSDVSIIRDSSVV